MRRVSTYVCYLDIPEELLRRTPRKRKKVDYSQTYGHDYDEDEDFNNSASEEAEDSEEVSEDEDEEDEEEEEEESSAEEESEDDTPLSDLAKKSAPSKRKANPNSRSKSKPKPKPKAKAKSKAKSKAKTNGRKKAKSTAAPVAEVVGQTAKEQIVEKILRRRSYCLDEWPPEGLTLDSSHASEFITCGIKGILVGFRGESTGLIKDLRPQNGLIPSVNCLLKKPTSELKELLLKGIEAQRADLEKHKEQNELQVFTVSRCDCMCSGKLYAFWM